MIKTIQYFLSLNCFLNLRLWLTILVLSHQALASSSTWNETPTSGNWNVAANWSNSHVPGVEQGYTQALFGPSSINNIFLATDVEVKVMQFLLGAAQYTINTKGWKLSFTGDGVNNPNTYEQTLLNSNNGLDYGQISFSGSASVGNKIYIENQGSNTSITFKDDSSAGTNFIHNYGDYSSVIFNNNSSAGTVSIFNNANGAGIFFNNHSNADNAQIFNQNGTVDISGLTAPSITIRSLSGAGAVKLGSNNLKVGNLNQDANISGVISDARSANPAALPGSLTKIGTGLLTLSGQNTHSGGTSIENGIVSVANDGNLGAVYSTGVNPNATLTLGTNAGPASTAGTLQTTGTFNTNRPITINTGGGIFDTAANTTLTLSGLITSEGKLTKTGNGTLALASSSTFSDLQLSSGTINNNFGRTFTNSGTLSNFGTLTNAGTLLNNINANISNNMGSTITNNGIFVNNGTLTNNNVLTNSKTLNNGGTLVNDGDFTNNNLGTIQNGYQDSLRGILTNNVHKNLNNYGTIKTANISSFNNEGNLTNYGDATITIDSGGTFNNSRTLANFGTLTNAGIINNSGTMTFNAGSVLQGDGTLTLTGGTLVDNGNTTIEWPIQVSGISTIISPLGNNFTINTAFVGLGSLIKKGAGTVTFTRSINHTDGTIIEEGTLKAFEIASLPGRGPVTVYSGATLDLANLNQEIETLAGEGEVKLGDRELTIYDDGSSTSFSGVISGVGGSLVKEGTGTLTLTGANTYTGATSIEGGRLMMNFVQPAGAGSVNISERGTLSGTGQIQQTVINDGGTVAPGDRLSGTGFETLTLVNGYQGSGTMNFKINAAGDHSTLASTNGAFDLRDTILSIACAGSLTGLDLSRRYTLIQGQNAAGNAIEGPFQSIPARVGKFVPEMIYNPDSVELSFDLVPTSFASETTSGNDRSVASELDRLSGIAEGPLEEFIFSLEGRSASELDDVFSQLDPATPGSMAETITTSGVVNALTQGRMHSIATGGSASNPGGATLTSGSGSGFPRLAASLSSGHGTDRPSHTRASLSQEQAGYQAFFGKGRGGIWAQGFALNHKQKSHKDIAGFGADTGGFITGIDTPFLISNLYVGGAIGYGRGDVDYKQARGKSKITSHLGSVYVLYDTETYYVDGSLAVGLNRYHNQRNIAVLGKTASSRHRGTEWAPHLGAGFNFSLSQVDVQPFINLEHTHLREAGYSEKNADFANLTVKSRSSSQWRGETGLNVSKTMLFTHGTWTPLIRLSYIRKQPHKKSKMRSSFEGQPQTFETETLNLKQDQVSPGLGLKFKLNNGLYVTARYDAELSKLSKVHEIGLKIGYAF